MYIFLLQKYLNFIIKIFFKYLAGFSKIYLFAEIGFLCQCCQCLLKFFEMGDEQISNLHWLRGRGVEIHPCSIISYLNSQLIEIQM